MPTSAKFYVGEKEKEVKESRVETRERLHLAPRSSLVSKLLSAFLAVNAANGKKCSESDERLSVTRECINENACEIDGNESILLHRADSHR